MKKSFFSFGAELEIISLLIRTRLWVQIIIAMILGLGAGLLLSSEGMALVPETLSLEIAAWIKLPGSIFLNLIQMVVIPLVISSIILGICASGDVEHLKRVGFRIFPYFVGTTTIAVGIGVLLALAIEPGNYINSDLLAASGAELAQTDVQTLKPQAVPEFIAELIPTNLAEAQLSQNMLQIVIFAIFIGVAVMLLPTDKKNLILSIADTTQEITLKIVSWAMLLALMPCSVCWPILQSGLVLTRLSVFPSMWERCC